MAKLVGIVFPDSGTVYSFRTDLTLKEGDKVVCDTARGLSVGQVHIPEVTDCKLKILKWVICKVDLDAHNKRLENEKRKAVIQKEIEVKIAQVEQKALLKHYAEFDPSIADLAKELEALEG